MGGRQMELLPLEPLFCVYLPPLFGLHAFFSLLGYIHVHSLKLLVGNNLGNMGWRQMELYGHWRRYVFKLHTYM